jgi:hypothetical protein
MCGLNSSKHYVFSQSISLHLPIQPYSETFAQLCEVNENICRSNMNIPQQVSLSIYKELQKRGSLAAELKFVKFTCRQSAELPGDVVHIAHVFRRKYLEALTWEAWAGTDNTQLYSKCTSTYVNR